ncbi:MAG: hypothetical protein IPM23_04235 [Candidatus Melainabacteria bacterium]|nr:hypothetical protein [Candidatus Melainabacteria bacterium]
MTAPAIVDRNLEDLAAPLLERYRGYLAHLRPGLSRDIYPWSSPEDVVAEVARRLRAEGWIVTRRKYTGSRVNYPGTYFLRLTAPGVPDRGGACRWLVLLLSRLTQAASGLCTSH